MNRFLGNFRPETSETGRRSLRIGYRLLIAAGLDVSLTDFTAVNMYESHPNIAQTLLAIGQRTSPLIGIVGAGFMGFALLTRGNERFDDYLRSKICKDVPPTPEQAIADPSEAGPRRLRLIRGGEDS